MREVVTMGQIIGEGITFDDVLLVPQYSNYTPNMVSLQTKLTNKITLNIASAKIQFKHNLILSKRRSY